MGSDFYNISVLPHAGIIIKICRAYTDNQEDFEDYYQEVCLQIWRSKESFKQQCKWSTWIYKITLNVCLTYFKKAQKIHDSFDSIALPEEAIADSKKASDEIFLLYRAIRQLSALDRAIILLYLEEVSYQNIADIIGLNSNNIGVRIIRIKQKLTKLIEEEL